MILICSFVDSFTKGCSSACNTPRKQSFAQCPTGASPSLPSPRTPQNQSVRANSSRGLLFDQQSKRLDESYASFVASSTPTSGHQSSSCRDSNRFPRSHGNNEFTPQNAKSSSSVRSQNSSRNSTSFQSIRSPNDTRSTLNDSLSLHETSATSTVHDKSRDRRTHSSAICLGDFITPNSLGKQQKQRKSTANASLLTSNDHDRDKLRNNRTPLTSTPRTDVTTPLQSSPASAASTTPTPISTRKTKSQPRRVVPTPVNRTQNDFTSPAFRCDDNLLTVTTNDAENTHQLLKTQKDEIRKVFQDERPSENQLRAFLSERISTKSSTATPTSPTTAATSTTTASTVSSESMAMVDLRKITNAKALNKFIEIYAAILDANLVTNILAELAYILSLVNVDLVEFHERNPEILSSSLDKSECDETTALIVTTVDIDLLLRNLYNCVYFALGVVQKQRHVLRLLDTNSLRVLIENKRLAALDDTIRNDLMTVYALKIQSESLLRQQLTISSSSSTIVAAAATSHGGTAKVFYQQEQDTQNNFPSSKEFAVFRKQRDAFYNVLR